MIRIERDAWTVMVEHARNTYPNECCGAMLGTEDGEAKTITAALPLDNVYSGAQEDRYEIRPLDLLRAEQDGRARGLSVIGIYHSHPDCDAYFSKTDLENASPWHSFVVLSIKKGEFDHANCFRPDLDLTRADPEPLEIPRDARPAAHI